MTQDEIREGARFGRLEVGREIGAGAFGRVYLAKDPLIARVVALKVLKGPAGAVPAAEDRAGFLAEARTVGGFSHPNIVTLYQAHEVGGGGFVLEMEYVDGGTLEDLLGEDERLPVARALAIACDVASALAAAHAAGVVHGDVKPGNVLLTKDGRVKLADFGLARLLGAREPATGPLGIAGTPFYMSPEVIQGEAFLPASDVWSLGVLLHRMLSGRLPFSKSALHPLFVAIQNEPAPALGPETPSEVARLVSRCLEKRAANRFADGSALHAALAARPDRGAIQQAPPPSGLVPADARVVGRAAECARIAAAMDGVAKESRSAGTVLVGPAGIGKSALARVAVEGARERGWGTLQATVSPVEGLLRPLAHAIDAADLGVTAGGTGPAPRTESVTADAVERSLASAAADRPLVLLVEDLHHLAPEEARVLVRLYRRLAHARILWVLTERTSDLAATASQHLRADAVLEQTGVVKIDVGPLGPDEASALVSDAAEGARLPRAVVSRIARRSAGNPFFALQLLRHLKESGTIVRRGEEWVVEDEAGASAQPPALREIVARRLRGLPESAHALLDVAAVDGFEFDGEAVAAVLDRPLLSVLRQFQALFRVQGLVAPRDRGFRFAHPLLQEVIYAEVSPELRREIHRRLAEHLTSRAEPADPERVGTHWERAGDAERASPHLLSAARAAAYRLENLRAVDLAARAGLAPGTTAAPLLRANAALALRVATCYGDLARFSDAERLLTDVLAAADGAGDLRLRWNATVTRVNMRYLGPGLRPGDEDDLRRAVEALPQGLDLGRARYMLGVIEKYRGNLEEAARWLKGADALFVEFDDVGQHGSALDQLASVALRSGRVEDAEALYVEAARVCRRVGQRPNAAVSDVNGALAAFSRGVVEGIEARLEEAVRTFDAEGAVNSSAHTAVILASVEYAQGRLAQARRTLSGALSALEKSGFLPGLVAARELEVDLRLAVGDLDGSARASDECRASVKRHGTGPEAVAVAAALDAQRLLVTGDVEAASVAARSAVTALGPTKEFRARAEVVRRISEACVWGMPAPALAEALSALGTPDRAVLPSLVTLTERTARAALAWAREDGAGVEDLRAGADSLLSDGVGARRAFLRALGLWFGAEASRREGDAPAAVSGARAALHEATGLGHVWLELGLLRWLDRASGSTTHHARRLARVDEIASRLRPGEARDRFEALWRR